MKRKIIKIDEELCNGCELCIPGCPEGAIQMIDGKARLISDRFCDGLGACLGECPEGAIEIEEREAEAYDEAVVMEAIAKQGPNVIKAHLEHLNDHGETELLKEAVDYLIKNNIDVPSTAVEEKPPLGCGCPGSMAKQFDAPKSSCDSVQGDVSSKLTHWPIQLHLLNPVGPAYKKADVLLAADCVPFAYGNFHADFLQDKALAIACPKLDVEQQIYLDKLVAMIDEAEINTLTVLIMQVPCCGGLSALARTASEKAKRKVPVKQVIFGLQGDILKEEWL